MLYLEKIDQTKQKLHRLFHDSDNNAITITLKQDGTEMTIEPIESTNTYKVICDAEFTEGRTYGAYMTGMTLHEITVVLNQYPYVLPDMAEAGNQEQRITHFFEESPDAQVIISMIQEFYDRYGFYPAPLRTVTKKQ